MATTNNVAAKRLCDALNSSRGLLGAGIVQSAVYSSGATFTVRLRDGSVKTVTVS